MVGCSSVNDTKLIANDTISPSPTEPQSNVRLLAFSEAFRHLHETAVKCQLREAANVAEYLKARAIPYQPMPDGRVTPLNIDRKDQWFALIGLLCTDYDMAKWAELRNAPFAASYQPDNDTITWRPGVFSDTWESILLLHEGFHLMQYRKRRYDWHDKRTFCIEEVRAHEFQNKITSKLGGKKYQALIQSVASKAANETKRQKLKNEEYSFCDLNKSWTLEEYFGPCNSVLEQNTRITHTWTAMAFATIDLIPTIKDKQEAKALFLLDGYQRTGVLR